MKKLLTNNIGYKILAIIAAIILWMVIVNIQDPMETRTISGIPITIVNDSVITDKDLAYTIESGDTAYVKVKGPRSIVDRLDASDFVATADFTELSITYAAPVNVEFSSENSQYVSQVDILDKTSSLVINIESIKTKNYTVEVSYSGNPASDSVVGTENLDVSTIEVSAPNSYLKDIKSVVLSIDVTGKSSDFSVDVQPTLLDEDGKVITLQYPISLNVASIHVDVIMHKLKELSLNFGTTGTVADGYKFSGLKYSPTTVKVHGLESDLADISSITIPSSLIDITGATGNVTKNIDISLYLPEGLTLYDESDKVISVTAQISGPVQKSFTLDSSQIEFRNVPESFTAAANAGSVTVTLSGSDDAMNALTTAQITGYIDLSGGTEGVNERQLVLNLPTGVSLVSPVKVSATLTKNSTTASSQTTAQ